MNPSLGAATSSAKASPFFPGLSIPIALLEVHLDVFLSQGAIQCYHWVPARSLRKGGKRGVCTGTSDIPSRR